MARVAKLGLLPSSCRGHAEQGADWLPSATAGDCGVPCGPTPALSLARPLLPSWCVARDWFTADVVSPRASAGRMGVRAETGAARESGPLHRRIRKAHSLDGI